MQAANQFQVRVKVIEAVGVSRKQKKQTCDPYVVAKFRGMKNFANSVQTTIVNNSQNPVWNQEVCLYPKSVNDILLLKVYDSDHHKKDNLLGMVEIPLERFYQTGASDTWLQLMKRKGGWKSLVGKVPFFYSVPGSLHIQLWFGSAQDASMISQGLAQNQQQQMMNQPMNTGMNQQMNQPMNTGMNQQNQMMNQPMNTGMNQPINSTGMNQPMNTGINQPINSTGMNQPINSTGMNQPMNSTGINQQNDLEWQSRDFESGFSPVNPNGFKWYNSQTTQTTTTTQTAI